MTINPVKVLKALASLPLSVVGKVPQLIALVIKIARLQGTPTNAQIIELLEQVADIIKGWSPEDLQKVLKALSEAVSE